MLFALGDIIKVPFGWLISMLYQLTSNYGVALILFAILVKVILYPTTAKSKKSTMKMSRMTPRIQAIQKKYEGDQQKINEETQKLYKAEGVSMGGGCLWSLLPLLILIPLYTVVRQPITYILRDGNVAQILEFFKGSLGENEFYSEMFAAAMIRDNREALAGIVEKASTLEGLDFGFLGVNLGEVPKFNVFKWTKADWTWANIGAVLIPLLSSLSQVGSMLISRKLNNSLVTDEKGLEDKETAKNSQANKSSNMMMFIMPLFSLWIGFTVPVALSLYWLAQGVVSTAIDVYLTKKYRKIYDAEDAERLRKAMEQEAIEAEKERQRAERRAANPDGITQNTSKKKLQQQQQREQEAARAAAKKEYEAKKNGEEVETEEAGNAPISGNEKRPFSKGRAYDPNRYAPENTEE